MNKITLIFASEAQGKKEIFNSFLNTEKIDLHYLCSESKPKILKKDVDLNFDILNNYKLICPVGAEALKYVCGKTGITKYNGILVENKYIPIIHPSLLEFRPQYKEDIARACNKIKELENSLDDLKSPSDYKDHRHITTEEEFEEYLYNSLIPSTEIVIDIETTSLSPKTGNIIGVAFSTKPHEGIFVDSNIVKKFVDILQEKILNDINKVIIFHNGKFDMRFLMEEFGFTFLDFEDTILLHYILDETLGSHGLKDLALKFTDLGDYDSELQEYKKSFCRKNKIKLDSFNYGMLPIEILAPYACKDGDSTMQLFHKFRPLVKKRDSFEKLYQGLLKPVTKALMVLEDNGGPIDYEKVCSVDEEYQIDIEECINELRLDPDVQRFERIYSKTFNPNSTAQLSTLFFELKGLTPVKTTATGNLSVDKEVLTELDHPMAELILEMREKVKLRGTYIANILNGIDFDYRLRSGFNITGTTSGRLSSSGIINYQNIPRDNKDIKKFFKARKGYKIVQADLGTAEVYVAAVLSEDKFLQQAFIDKVDFHSYIAKQIFNLPCEIHEVPKKFPQFRQHAKAITFGIMYQAGPATIASTADVSFREAQQFIKKYFNEADMLEKWINSASSFIANNAYIYSFFGRKRRLPESRSPNKGVSKHAIRSGVNFLVQSVASDINLFALIDSIDWIIKNNLREEIIPFTVVHDSIVAEVKEDLVEEVWVPVLGGYMQADRGIMIPDTPIKVDFEIGPSWGELEEKISL